jgi:hypothetical protein
MRRSQAAFQTFESEARGASPGAVGVAAVGPKSLAAAADGCGSSPEPTKRTTAFAVRRIIDGRREDAPRAARVGRAVAPGRRLPFRDESRASVRAFEEIRLRRNISITPWWS